MQRIVFESRTDEPFRTFGDGCCGTIRTINAGGDKRVLEVRVIGQMDNTIDHTFESANRVYDVGGVSPTINTCGGGGLQPKILENFKMEGNNFNQRNIVHGEYGICRTIIGQGHCGNEPKVIVAMRGRNPDNPSDRTVGSPTEQRLEPNSQGICNTLTSVQKDNLVMEVKQLGFMDNGTGQHQSNTVYDENHVCPSITTIEGGGTQQIKVLKDVSALRMVRTEDGKLLRKQYENHEIKHGFNEHRTLEPRKDGVSNTLSTVQKDNMLLETVKIKQATKDGYIECEVGGIADLSFPDSETRRGRVQENGQVSPTLMAGESDICRIEKVGQISSDGSQYGTVISENGLCSTLSAGTHGYANNCIQTQYRIRKLTPLECWRLMNFTDQDFRKAEAVNSNTQLYKQAGNSIVKNVLVAIFGQMIDGKEEVYKEG